MRRRVGAVLAVALLVGLSAAGRAAEGDATAILDRSIAALGGQEKLAGIKAVSWTTKGTVALMGNEVPVTTRVVMQGLERSRQEIDGEFMGQAFKAVTVLNADKGWRDVAGNRADLEGAGLAGERRRAYLTLIPVTVVPLKGSGFKLEAAGEEAIAGKPAVGVKVTPPDGREFTLHFDKESGLPVRMVAKVSGPMGGEFTQETTFSDYQEMGGIKKATRVVAKRNGEKFMEQTVSDFKILDEVDPKTFSN